MIVNTEDLQRAAREELSAYIGGRVREVMSNESKAITCVRLAEGMAGRTGLNLKTTESFISDVRTGFTNYVLGFDRRSSDEMRRRNLNCLAVLFEDLGFYEDDEIIARTRQIYSGFVYPPAKRE